MSYDLFISYCRRDNSQRRISQLVEHISADFASFAGRSFQPFFDVTEIQGMADWRHRILQGLRESRLLLACLSPAYVSSEYCAWEFNEYLKHEVARAVVGEGVAPVYFVEVPGWGDKDFEQRCAEWVAELRRRQHFDLRPWFHEGEDALRNTDVQARMGQLKRQIAERIRRGERAEQTLGNVDAHNAHFIGRTTELRRLRETVALGKVGVLAAVHGLGGMGKTALAIEYAHAFAYEYGGGCWQLRCEGREDLCSTLTMLAPALGIEFTDDEKRAPELQFQRVLTELRRLADAREPHRCLLLLDNVDRPKLLEPAQTQRLPAADWLHIIATTRLGENDLFGQHRDRAFLAVDDLPETDALQLIETYQPGGKFPSEADHDAAQEIVRLLGRFTLAVETAAVFLGQFAGDVTCAGFLERLKKDGLEGLENAAGQTSEGVLHGEKRLSATLRPTLERLGEAEKLALTFAALLPSDHIALPWIRALTAQKFPDLGRESDPGFPDPWQSLVRCLLSLRLWQVTGVVDADGQPLVVRMHRLLQAFVKADAVRPLEPLEQAFLRHTKSRAEFIRDGWVQPGNRWELAPVVASAWQWMERRSEDGADLASRIADPLRQLGDFATAEPLVRRALAIDEETLGPTHPRVAGHLNELALLLGDKNRLTEAEPLLRGALAICEQSFGPNHHSVASALGNLGGLLQTANRLAEAEPLMRRALVISEESLGPKDPHFATALNNVANLLQVTNRLTEAEPLMRRALAIDEESLGPNHPKVATTLNNLAHLLRATNRLAEAEPLLRRALAIREQSFGPNHPGVASALNNLAVLLQHTNRLAEAEPLMRRALAIYEQSFGPNHPSVASALSNLAQSLQATNRLTEAEPLMRRALAIHEESLGLGHPDVARDLNNLGRLLQATNRLTEAEPMLRRALAIYEESLVPNHPDVSMALSNLALLLQAMDRLAEAEPLVSRALDIGERSLGPNHPDVAISVGVLAKLLKATNRLAQAEPLMRRALALEEQGFGPNHPRVATALNNLALLLGATNRPAEAEPLLRRALAIDQESLGPNHPEVAADLSSLGTVLQATNRLTEAEPLLRRALAIIEQGLIPNHPDVAMALGNLAQLLKATSRLAEAEPLLRRAMAITEHSYGANHPKVARDLNSLAELLRATNRLEEAEPLLRRALAIFEQSCVANHPEVATVLNHLAGLLKATNRQGEAEPLYRRALTIDEQSYGANHPEVATDLNNLAVLLQDINRLAEAEPLLRRALDIQEQTYGANHPKVACTLNNLAGLLHATNRLEEAEPLFQRALAINEQSYGANHPEVAIILYNLAGLLRATNRLGEAEPLLRRALATYLDFTRHTGHPHPHLKTTLEDYFQLLIQTGLSQEPAVARIRELAREYGLELGGQKGNDK